MSETSVARERLRAFIERIERLEEQKQEVAEDIRDVYGEAKAEGFDVKVMRQVVRMRKVDASQRQEEDAVRDIYLQALGMLPDFEE